MLDALPRRKDSPEAKSTSLTFAHAAAVHARDILDNWWRMHAEDAGELPGRFKAAMDELTAIAELAVKEAS